MESRSSISICGGSFSSLRTAALLNDLIAQVPRPRETASSIIFSAAMEASMVARISLAATPPRFPAYSRSEQIARITGGLPLKPGLKRSTLRTRSGSVIRQNFQACTLLAEGAKRPASISVYRSLQGTALSRKCLQLRRDFIKVNKSSVIETSFVKKVWENLVFLGIINGIE